MTFLHGTCARAAGVCVLCAVAPQMPLLQSQQQQQQPLSSGCRSLSFMSQAAAAAAMQHPQCLGGLAQAGPSLVQQLTQSAQWCRPQPTIWQQQQPFQHQQPFQQQQHLPGQVRGFVLMPRRVKYRKAHKSMGFNETICGNTRQLAFGLYGIRALEHCRIPASTLEAVRCGQHNCAEAVLGGGLCE